jgi:hypothetical protein
VAQTLRPSRIYVFLSEAGYLLDTGFPDEQISHAPLAAFLGSHAQFVQLLWLPSNGGSYRKLLPLLREKWDEDCRIVTVDDDVVYAPGMLAGMVRESARHGCVIANRCHRIANWPGPEFRYDITAVAPPGRSRFDFPTGCGAVLYEPRFFRGTGDLVFRQDVYGPTCPTADDIWFYLLRLLNSVDCYHTSFRWCTGVTATQGLFVKYNELGARNADMLWATVRALPAAAIRSLARWGIRAPRASAEVPVSADRVENDVGPGNASVVHGGEHIRTRSPEHV